MLKQFDWAGVFPATTTQFAPDMSIDMPATNAVQRKLLEEGVAGLVLMGTVGENNSLTAIEKRALLTSARRSLPRDSQLIAGVCELTTESAVAFARDAESAGASALMVLPAMVYVPSPHELVQHFRDVAQATSLPIMLYNNPPAYRVQITFDVLEALTDLPNIQALKESSPDTRRFTDLQNAFGGRFVLMAGLDDVALEGLLLGARGWISGLTNAFPSESIALYRAAAAGDIATALAIYRWFMPLLHLDADHDLVQSIKLAEQLMGRGSERVRPPRRELAGARRDEVERRVRAAVATRPPLLVDAS